MDGTANPVAYTSFERDAEFAPASARPATKPPTATVTATSIPMRQPHLGVRSPSASRSTAPLSSWRRSTDSCRTRSHWSPTRATTSAMSLDSRSHGGDHLGSSLANAVPHLRLQALLGARSTRQRDFSSAQRGSDCLGRRATSPLTLSDRRANDELDRCLWHRDQRRYRAHGGRRHHLRRRRGRWHHPLNRLVVA